MVPYLGTVTLPIIIPKERNLGSVGIEIGLLRVMRSAFLGVVGFGLQRVGTSGSPCCLVGSECINEIV